MEDLSKNLRFLVETFELEVSHSGDDIELRVEIFQHIEPSGHYSARIWRLEHYRLQPTFPQEKGVPAHSASDELILKEFEGFDSPLAQSRHFPTSLDARKYVLEKLDDWLAKGP